LCAVRPVLSGGEDAFGRVRARRRKPSAWPRSAVARRSPPIGAAQSLRRHDLPASASVTPPAPCGQRARFAGGSDPDRSISSPPIGLGEPAHKSDFAPAPQAYSGQRHNLPGRKPSGRVLVHFLWAKSSRHPAAALHQLAATARPGNRCPPVPHRQMATDGALWFFLLLCYRRFPKLV